MHVVEAVSDWARPAAQATHVSLAGTVLYVPAGQSLQAEAREPL